MVKGTPKCKFVNRYVLPGHLGGIKYYIKYWLTNLKQNCLKKYFVSNFITLKRSEWHQIRYLYHSRSNPPRLEHYGATSVGLPSHLHIFCFQAWKVEHHDVRINRIGKDFASSNDRSLSRRPVRYLWLHNPNHGRIRRWWYRKCCG